MEASTFLKTIFVTSLIVTLAYGEICPPGYHTPNNGHCSKCPDRCETCNSDINCTECESNYYGLICQDRCLEECKDRCQKEFGYCTHGCPEGEFLSGNDTCEVCPSNCVLCKLANDCVLCRPGYHGDICQDPCSRHCNTCDKNTGKCRECREGYALLMLNDGEECIRECSIDQSGISNVTYDCIDTESGHGFLNKPIMPCPEAHHCFTDENDSGTCEVKLNFRCTHRCQLVNGSNYQCEPHRKTKNGNDNRTSIYNISITQQCFPAFDVTTGATCQQHDTDNILWGFLAVALFALFLNIIFDILLCTNWGRSKWESIWKKRNTEITETEIGLMESQTGQHVQAQNISTLIGRDVIQRRATSRRRKTKSNPS